MDKIDLSLQTAYENLPSILDADPDRPPGALHKIGGTLRLPIFNGYKIFMTYYPRALRISYIYCFFILTRKKPIEFVMY